MGLVEQLEKILDDHKCFMNNRNKKKLAVIKPIELSEPAYILRTTSSSEKIKRLYTLDVYHDELLNYAVKNSDVKTSKSELVRLAIEQVYT